MRRRCAISGSEFEVLEEDLKFYDYLGVPPPTLCPTERQRRRISYRNFRSLNKTTCAATGAGMISMYSPEAPFPVYNHNHWWSDDWDPKSYGRDFDFSRPFFEQYKDLADVVPRSNIQNIQCENCLYSNFAFQSRNCYLIFGCVVNDECIHGHIVWNSERCVDGLYLYRCQWCSNSIDCVDCYEVHFSEESVNCQESYFLFDCRNCRNCFGCTNLRGAQYCLFNQQLSKADYEAQLAELLPLSHESIAAHQEWLEKAKLNAAVYPPNFGNKVEDVSGNHIYESKNTKSCFDIKSCEDSKYLFTVQGAKNGYDMSFTGGTSSFVYECLTLTNSTEIICSHLISECNNIGYSEFCFSSNDLFGCNGLRNASYCILNKQYSETEYKVLRTKIIEHMKETGEWGEFFPSKDSPFAYNESIVNEYLPLIKEEALSRGLQWRDEAPATQPSTAVGAAPTLCSTDEEILSHTFRCIASGKPFKLVKAELDFLRRMNLPLPITAPNVRHEQRMKQRLPRRLYDTACKQCGNQISAAISPNDPRQVLCETCYLKLIH